MKQGKINHRKIRSVSQRKWGMRDRIAIFLKWPFPYKKTSTETQQCCSPKSVCIEKAFNGKIYIAFASLF